MSVPSSTDPADAPPSRSSSRMPRALRRNLILAAARREFAVNGYHATSTAMIAHRSQCSEPTLYKHFASKLGLFLELLRARANRDDGPWIDFLKFRDSSESVDFEAILPILLGDANYQESAHLTNLAVTIIDEPGVRDLLREIEDQMRASTHESITQGISVGRIRSDVTPDYVSTMWLAIVAAACARDAIEPGNGFDAMLPYAQRFIRSIRA